MTGRELKTVVPQDVEYTILSRFSPKVLVYLSQQTLLRLVQTALTPAVDLVFNAGSYSCAIYYCKYQ